jgi:hypothetical protein
MVLGAALLGGLITTTPSDAIDVFQKAGFGTFFATIHATFEWVLIPLAVAANWTHPSRRRWLIVVAAVFYVGRLTSSLYFAPHALAWGADPAYSPGVLDDVQIWLVLNWIRIVLQDGVTAGLLAWITVRVIPYSSSPAGAASAPCTPLGSQK